MNLSALDHRLNSDRHRNNGVLVRVSIAVKGHGDHSNSYEGKHFIEVAASSSEIQSVFIMMGSMAAHRQT